MTKIKTRKLAMPKLARRRIRIFRATLPPDMQARLGPNGDCQIDYDEDTGLCAIYPRQKIAADS